MTSSSDLPVAILPPDGALAARVARLLSAAGVTLATAPTADVEVAVIDLTSPDAPAALSALSKRAPRVALLAITEPARETGAAVLDTVSPGALDDELVPRLARLRARLALLTEAQQRQRDLQVLLALTARYADALDVEALLHDVTRQLAEEMSIDRAALVVVDQDRGEGTIVAASDDAALKNLRIDLARYPEIREVVRTGKPVIVEDAPSHPLLEDVRDTVAARGIAAIAALPLAAGGKVQGVMLFRRTAGRGAFNRREVDFLATVAHATAIAFRNVRQLEWVQGQHEREQAARLAAEERVRSLQRYEVYFEHLSDGVAILDGDARVVSLNPAGLRLLDCRSTEALGRHINALTNPSDEGLLLDVVVSVRKGEVRAGLDLPVRTQAGRRLTLEVSAAPLGGQVREGVAILTLRDVTAQRELARELTRTKEFLERLINASDDAVIASDMRGNIILVNKAAEGIYGWTAADVVGRLHVTQLYAQPGTAQDILRKLRSHEHGGPGRMGATRLEIFSRTGERIPVNMTASLILEGTREVATVGIFTDLRDRLSLERKLTDVEARLLESEKTAVIVALAGTAAHELNQPLTSVMGYSELLKRKLKESDPAWRSVDIIHREAERMAEIVRKIGKITRYETKAYVGNAQIVDLDKAAGHED